MARTFSKSANEFIDNNAKSKTSIAVAEFAVNMAVQIVIGIVRRTLIDFCPHKEVCSKQYARGGCDCSYLDKHMNSIKANEQLCFNPALADK